MFQFFFISQIVLMFKTRPGLKFRHFDIGLLIIRIKYFTSKDIMEELKFLLPLQTLLFASQPILDRRQNLAIWTVILRAVELEDSPS